VKRIEPKGERETSLPARRVAAEPMSKFRTAWGLVVVLVAGLLGAGAWLGFRPTSPSTGGEGTPAETPLFRDRTADSGVRFTYRNGQEANHYAILESLGGGVALIDYDGDGLLDVFVAGGGYFDGPAKKEIKGHPCKLYRNKGGWKFEDVTAEAGLENIPFYTHGCAVADYDCDGRPDLLVTGYGRLALFRNVGLPGGRRGFVEVTREAGLLGQHFWSTSAAWADLDGDGFPDLYVCQYVDWSFENNPPCEGYQRDIPRDVCPPKVFDSRPHALYRNNGKGAFTEVGKEAGLHTSRSDRDYDQLGWMDERAKKQLREADRDRDFGKGLGVVIVDVNGDGRPDVYVANDTTDKFLYVNRGGRGQMRLEDLALELGVARDESGAPNGSMGVDADDYDGSGLPSLLVTNYQNENHALYRNVSAGGKLSFVPASRAAGLTGIGRQYVGFGTHFLDFDNDGWEDIVIGNGHVIRYPSGSPVRQLPVLLHNQGRRAGKEGVRFLEVGARGGDYFKTVHQGRGLAVGDLDNDGRPDLVISHLNEPVVLLRNEASPGRHWLGIDLHDRQHRDLVGAKLTLEVGERRLTRFAKGGGSYLSSGDRRHLFGLGAAEQVGKLTVAWPWGSVESWEGLPVDRYWRLVAGVKEAQPFPASGSAAPTGP
jgi:hypothetical protein